MSLFRKIWKINLIMLKSDPLKNCRALKRLSLIIQSNILPESAFSIGMNTIAVIRVASLIRRRQLARMRMMPRPYSRKVYLLQF